MVRLGGWVPVYRKGSLRPAQVVPSAAHSFFVADQKR
jgi:hypothetical protein